MERVAKLTSDRAHVRVVFAADPGRAWEVIRNPSVLQGLRAVGVRVVSLEPWHDPAVRQWLEDCQFGPSDKSGRDELRRITGNWPWLLAEFHRRCQSGGSWRDRLCELEADLPGPNLRAELLRAFGLDAGRADVLRPLAQYGTLPQEELANYVGDANRVGAVLRWAELLLLADQGEDGWRLEPVVAGLLHAAAG